MPERDESLTPGKTALIGFYLVTLAAGAVADLFFYGSLINFHISAYQDYIRWASIKHGVPEALIKAVIWIESAGNPRAYRAEPKIKDASYGLMQILLNSARTVGYRDTASRLYDPKTNIDYGTAYLAQQYRRYNQNIADTLSAYNGGRVLKYASGKYANETYVLRGIRAYNALV